MSDELEEPASPEDAPALESEPSPGARVAGPVRVSGAPFTPGPEVGFVGPMALSAELLSVALPVWFCVCC